MEDAVKKGILQILNKINRAVVKNDSALLKLISEDSVQNAGIYQDEDSITIAVVGYALSKTCQRCIVEEEGKPLHTLILSELQKARDLLEKGNEQEYRKHIKSLVKDIISIDNKFKIYIEEVIEKAKIKKGSALYATGISMGRASELLGISQWELMNYLGKTTLSDQTGEAVPTGERLAFARGLFK
jgi:hypothetical protein